MLFSGKSSSPPTAVSQHPHLNEITMQSGTRFRNPSEQANVSARIPEQPLVSPSKIDWMVYPGL